LEVDKVKNKFKKIGISLMIVGFFLVGIQTGSALPQGLPRQPMAKAGWLYVGGGGPGNYTTIQSAINAASNGDTIFVYAGTYLENILVDKSLMLMGQERNVTTIQGNNLKATVEITAESIMLQGFTVKNDGTQYDINTSTSDHTFTNDVFTMASRGIHLYYSSGNTITNNLFFDNTHSGIYVDVGQNNTLSDNEFYNNTDEGISLTGCGTSNIERNVLRNNGEGIHAYQAEGNIISNNVIESNSYGIHFAGMITIHSNFNTISHNRIDDNSICGLRIEHSEFNRIEFNEIKGNGKGIQFDFTGANLIRENVITASTSVEVDLTFSFGDLIIKNNIDNTQTALVLVQINFGFSDASNNWWGSVEWPLRRIRPIGGWVMILPWRMGPFDLSVGPEL
jgi:nitrous oxidase accessory protein